MFNLPDYVQSLVSARTDEGQREFEMIVLDALDGESLETIKQKIEANFYKDFING